MQTSLQRVCGGRVSSNIFLIQVSILKFVWHGFLFREFLQKNAFEGILVRIRSSDFFGRDSSSQFAGNVSLEILPYRFFPIVLGSDFSSKISWYFFSSDFFWKKDLFKVCLVDNYSSEILGTGFAAEIFWQ